MKVDFNAHPLQKTKKNLKFMMGKENNWTHIFSHPCLCLGIGLWYFGSKKLTKFSK